MVLIAGGTYSSSSAELYNPSSGTFTATDSLITACPKPTATLLESGWVLIAQCAELYNPATGTFSATGGLLYPYPRINFTSTRLNNGMVLIAGGETDYGDSVSNAQLYQVPEIEDLSPASGRTGTSVTITGTHFGTTQGTSTVTFNGVSTTPTNWTDTGIAVTVPTAATTGNVVVTVSGTASNGSSFTVLTAPGITSLSPSWGTAGTHVTITGTNFGTTGTVTFNGTTATTTSWSDTEITATVPDGAMPGNGSFVVTALGVASDGANFTVFSGPTIISANTATFTMGAGGSFAVRAAGYPTPIFIEAGTLPVGVTFDALSGVLSGVPAEGTVGTYSITFTAHNGVDPDATQSFSLSVQPEILRSYSFRQAITIDHTKAPNTDQVNFPVLISDTYPSLATLANGGNVYQRERLRHHIHFRSQRYEPALI